MLFRKEIPRVFVSYRGSRRDLALKISESAKAAGWTSDTIEEYLQIPFAAGSMHEYEWLTDRFAERIESGCTFVIMASDDVNESHWVLSESVEGFLKAYRIIFYWVSGNDPLRVVFPLPIWTYRLMSCPQAFIIDARRNPDETVAAITGILKPSRRYRITLRLQQFVTALLGIAMAISPVTVLLVSSLLPAATANTVRYLFLRPWVVLILLWFSAVIVGVFYPSYGGPLRLASDKFNKQIRLVTPGFAGWAWRRMIYPVAFILACFIDGISFFNLKSLSTVGVGTVVKAFIISIMLGLLYQRLQLNLFTSHIGTIYRRLAKHYGLDFRDIARMR